MTALLISNYTRGAMSGLGLVNIAAGLLELADCFSTRGPKPSDDEPS
jgi:hypothetical protein